MRASLARSGPVGSVGSVVCAALLSRFIQGVSVESHQWPGTFHRSQAILSAEVSERQNAELAAALRHAPVQCGARN